MIPSAFPLHPQNYPVGIPERHPVGIPEFIPIQSQERGRGRGRTYPSLPRRDLRGVDTTRACMREREGALA